MPAPLKHPLWTVAAGCGLAFLGAGVNAAFLIEFGTSISHLTGDVSKVGIGLSEGGGGNGEAARYLLSAAGGFVAGACAAGFLIHHPVLELKRPYGRAVAGIGLILLGAHFLRGVSPAWAIGLAACAAGGQNALAARYRGMVLRTTHVTGLLTDLGTNLGMRLRGHDIARWKILVPALLVLGFLAGAVAGAAITMRHLPATLIFSGLYVGAGCLFGVVKHRARRAP